MLYFHNLRKYNKSSAVADMGHRLATTDIDRKVGSPGPLPWRGELSPHNTKAYFRIKWHPGSSSRLATIDMGRKMGDCVPFRRGQLGPRLTQCRLGRGLPPYQVADWPQQTWTEKWGLLYPLFGGSCPHLTQCGIGRGLPPYGTKRHLEPSSRLATTEMGRNVGCCAPFSDPHLTQCRLGRGLPLY